jgi:hypothetical protein
MFLLFEREASAVTLTSTSVGFMTLINLNVNRPNIVEPSKCAICLLPHGSYVLGTHPPE